MSRSKTDDHPGQIRMPRADLPAGSTAAAPPTGHRAGTAGPKAVDPMPGADGATAAPAGTSTPSDPSNQIAEPRRQGHTIVGGRPAGQVSLGGKIPRVMEFLVKKAAIEPAFRDRLLADRSRVAAGLEIDLDPAERAMLDHIPARQLAAIIAGTRVTEPQRRVLTSGGATTAIVALLAQLTFAPVAARGAEHGHPDAGDPTLTAGNETHHDYPMQDGGVRPDWPEQSKGIRPDFPMPPGGARPDPPPNAGIAPDVPPEPPPAVTPARPGTGRITLESLDQQVIDLPSRTATFDEHIAEMIRVSGVGINIADGAPIDRAGQVRFAGGATTPPRALRQLCELAATDSDWEIVVIAGELWVRRGAGGSAPVPPQPGIRPTPMPPGNDTGPGDPGATSRGMRPDLPYRRPPVGGGHRP